MFNDIFFVSFLLFSVPLFIFVFFLLLLFTCASSREHVPGGIGRAVREKMT